MSVSSMARLAEGDSAEPDSTLQSALRLVAAYIPSEAIVIYVALLGLLNPSSEATSDDVIIVRFVCFAIGFTVAIGLAFVSFKGTNLTRRELRRREFIVAGIASVAFAVYAAAMPSFFFSGTILTLRFSQWAAVVAVLVALLLPMIARSLGVRK